MVTKTAILGWLRPSKEDSVDMVYFINLLQYTEYYCICTCTCMTFFLVPILVLFVDFVSSMPTIYSQVSHAFPLNKEISVLE
jgi:hypothetical protein